MLFLSWCEHSTEPWFSLSGPGIPKSILLDLIVSTNRLNLILKGKR